MKDFKSDESEVRLEDLFRIRPPLGGRSLLKSERGGRGPIGPHGMMGLKGPDGEMRLIGETYYFWESNHC